MPHNNTPRRGDNQAVPIYVNSKIVGVVSGGIFCKTVSSSKHFLTTPPAICLDAQSIEDAEKLGASLVEIFDRETGIIRRASFSQFSQYGFDLDRGFGLQRALPMCRWSVSSASDAPAVVPTQPLLFALPRMG